MNLQFYDKTDKVKINTIDTPTTYLNNSNPGEIEIHLWNRKGGKCNFIASDIEISCLNLLKTISSASNFQGQEVIDENLLEVKSSGVVGTGIIDDNTDWTPIGKIDKLTIGDIPVNCCRKLFFRINSTEENLSRDVLFYLKISYNYIRLQSYTYNKVLSKGFFNKFLAGGKIA